MLHTVATRPEGQDRIPLSASEICKQDFLPLWQKFTCDFLSFRVKYISNVLPVGREWISDFFNFGENMFKNF